MSQDALFISGIFGLVAFFWLIAAFDYFYLRRHIRDKEKRELKKQSEASGQ